MNPRTISSPSPSGHVNYIVLATAPTPLVGDLQRAISTSRSSGVAARTTELLTVQELLSLSNDRLDGVEVIVPVDGKNERDLSPPVIVQVVEHALQRARRVVLISHAAAINSDAEIRKLAFRARGLRFIPVPSNRALRDVLEVLWPELQACRPAQLEPSRLEHMFSLQRVCVDRPGIVSGLSNLLRDRKFNIQYLGMFAYGLTARLDLVARLPNELDSASTGERAAHVGALQSEIESLLAPLLGEALAYEDSPKNARSIARTMLSAHGRGLLKWRDLNFESGVLARLVEPLVSYDDVSVTRVLVRTDFSHEHPTQAITIEAIVPKSLDDQFRWCSNLIHAYKLMGANGGYLPTEIGFGARREVRKP